MGFMPHLPGSSIFSKGHLWLGSLHRGKPKPCFFFFLGWGRGWGVIFFLGGAGRGGGRGGPLFFFGGGVSFALFFVPGGGGWAPNLRFL